MTTLLQNPLFIIVLRLLFTHAVGPWPEMSHFPESKWRRGTHQLDKLGRRTASSTGTRECLGTHRNSIPTS